MFVTDFKIFFVLVPSIIIGVAGDLCDYIDDSNNFCNDAPAICEAEVNFKSSSFDFFAESSCNEFCSDNNFQCDVAWNAPWYSWGECSYGDETECSESGSKLFCSCVPVDSDGDGAFDHEEECPLDPNKTEEGTCGCGIPETLCSAECPTLEMDCSLIKISTMTMLPERCMGAFDLNVTESYFGKSSVDKRKLARCLFSDTESDETSELVYEGVANCGGYDINAFVFWLDIFGAVVLAFRPTEPTSFTDWALDFDWTTIDFEMNGMDFGKVHRGFSTVYEETCRNSIDQIVSESLKKHEGSARRIVVTGHSQGAALSPLFAAHMATNSDESWLAIRNDLPICSLGFGQPSIGDEIFKNTMDDLVASGRLGCYVHYSAMFYNSNKQWEQDIITTMPPPGKNREYVRSGVEVELKPAHFKLDNSLQSMLSRFAGASGKFVEPSEDMVHDVGKSVLAHMPWYYGKAVCTDNEPGGDNFEKRAMPRTNFLGIGGGIFMAIVFVGCVRMRRKRVVWRR